MFEDIARDATSGASRLARLAAGRLSETAESLKEADPGTFWERLVETCAEMVAAKREMAPIVNLAGAVLSAAERVILSGRSPETAIQAVRFECSRVSEFGEERLKELGEAGAPLVADGSLVATLSDGESVRAVLGAAVSTGRTFEVLLSESRPHLEGLALAEHLTDLGVRTRLVTDSALPGLVSDAQLALIGADSVSERSLVNKVGSYALALAAREAGVPAYAAALKDKLLPEALRGDFGRPRDGAEILADPPETVAVLNRYFEEVPLALIRAIVTEDGVSPADEIPDMLRARPVPPALLQLLFAPRR